jgi:hypothetical protein
MPIIKVHELSNEELDIELAKARKVAPMRDVKTKKKRVSKKGVVTVTRTVLDDMLKEFKKEGV